MATTSQPSTAPRYRSTGFTAEGTFNDRLQDTQIPLGARFRELFDHACRRDFGGESRLDPEAMDEALSGPVTQMALVLDALSQEVSAPGQGKPTLVSMAPPGVLLIATGSPCTAAVIGIKDFHPDPETTEVVRGHLRQEYPNAPDDKVRATNYLRDVFLDDGTPDKEILYDAADVVMFRVGEDKQPDGLSLISAMIEGNITPIVVTVVLTDRVHIFILPVAPTLTFAHDKPMGTA